MWVLSADDSTLLASWTQLLYPTAPVTSVAGRTGAVTISTADVSGLGTLATQSGIFSGTSSGTNTGDQDLSGKQDTLVSATNIKTINSASLLGSGDIVVSASPGGSSGQMQFNNAGAFGGTVAIVYATTVVHQIITAQGPTIVCGVDRGAASQTANLREWQNSAGSVIAAISSNGSMAIGANTPAHRLDVNGNIRCTSIIVMGGSINVLERASLDGGTGVIVGQYDGSIMLRGNFPSVVFAKFAGGAAFFGNGETSSAPPNYTLNGTSGSGTNIAATSIKWAPGKSTGNAAPAKYTIQRTVALSSGTTAQSLTDALEIDGNTTAGETPMLLLDITAGTMRRVSIGVADSGGVGFRVLRIPN